LKGCDFMRVSEVAAVLGVSPSRAYRLIALGVIPAMRIGGRILVPRPAWEEWIKRATCAALASAEEGGGTPS